MSIATTIRERLRDILNKAGLLGIARQVIGRKQSHLAHAAIADRFGQIYSDRVWQRGDPALPLSGAGSTLAATENLRARLPLLLATLGAKRLLDVGCGDFTWMSQIALSGVDYIGADVVPSVIEGNVRRYGNQSTTFVVANAISDQLPEADAVLCREVLFHLSFADAKAVLRNILRTGAAHLLLTTDTATKVNSDIVSGDYRVLNLGASPFALPQPISLIDESASLPGRRIGCWSADAVRSVLGA